MQIKTLFAPNRNIYRTIEKVITYSAGQEARLKSEISEYIVTDSIEDQFERLLSKMQLAMETGGENEIGVWVSGFYGSGKSSFTKYLGLALDETVSVDGTRFLKLLQDRMTKATTRALLSTVAARFPMAVVLLDLASEMLAGATMEEVSTVLYYKVLQAAGYSRNLKVAALERRLKKDGRFEEFEQRVQADLGVPWRDVQNDPLVIDSFIPELAHAFYPALFKTPESFHTETAHIVQFENERVAEMIDIIRAKTGCQYIAFILDEVGQYVGGRPQLILNLDGLAKNLKNIGDGKVWIFATAQQTLTEDDPRAALNSPELYKLSARFPIQIDLESKDIKEICYRRLLEKSPQGQAALEALFDKHGAELRHNTRLEDARYYDAGFDKTTFTNLYPFLPAHFDILLHLLGVLAKSTGGIGLRSAIKVVQDILIEGAAGQPPVADHPTGWLVTTATLYDSLEKEIRRHDPGLHTSVGKVVQRFPNSPLHHTIAKTVVVLQLLDNMPVTPHNVASLLHPAVAEPGRQAGVEAAVQELIADGFVPFGEKDGSLCFFSEKINTIDQERGLLQPRTVDSRSILSKALQDALTPLPATRLNGSLQVSTGLKMLTAGNLSSLAGDKETIQTVVELAAPDQYAAARLRLVEESRQRSAFNIIYWLGHTAPEINTLVAEIFRSREIANSYRSDPAQEVKDYCTAQTDRANRLSGELEHLLQGCLRQGSFIFRGQVTAVESLDPSLLEAARKHLSGVAAQVFERYAEASVRADTTLAEKFLRQSSNLKAISSDLDPLGLVQITAGSPRIIKDHKALISIRDFIDRNGSTDGKRLTEHFGDAPFGWSPDTLRYLVAAMLVNGELKLRISGREITVSGQQSIEALRTNNSFKPVGVALRSNQLAPEVAANAAQRLTELTGESVVPLEQEISRIASKAFPQLQHSYGPLEEKLRQLGLPGVETVRDLNRDLTEILETDASDVPLRLGSVDSGLYTALKWAAAVTLAFKNGLEDTLRQLRLLWQDVRSLPDSGIPGQLKLEGEEALQPIAERLGLDNFYTFSAELNAALTTMRKQVEAAARKMADEQMLSIRAAQETLINVYEWQELNQAEQTSIMAELEALVIQGSYDIKFLQSLINQQFNLHTRTTVLKQRVIDLGRQRQLESREAAFRDASQKTRPTLRRSVQVAARFSSAGELDALIQQLIALRRELDMYGDIEVTLELKD